MLQYSARVGWLVNIEADGAQSESFIEGPVPARPRASTALQAASAARARRARRGLPAVTLLQRGPGDADGDADMSYRLTGRGRQPDPRGRQRTGRGNRR